MLDRALYFSTLGLAAYLAAVLAPPDSVYLYVCAYVFAHTCFYRIAVADLFDAQGAWRGLRTLVTHPVKLFADITVVLLIAQGSIYLTLKTARGDVQYALIIGYMLAFALGYNAVRKKFVPPGNDE